MGTFMWRVCAKCRSALGHDDIVVSWWLVRRSACCAARVVELSCLSGTAGS